jgi:hypothetical protein
VHIRQFAIPGRGQGKENFLRRLTDSTGYFAALNGVQIICSAIHKASFYRYAFAEIDSLFPARQEAKSLKEENDDKKYPVFSFPVLLSYDHGRICVRFR